MKRIIPYLLSALLSLTSVLFAKAQTDLAGDQNPNYALSRDRYMKMADSINAWHSTTQQQTYKAIDYLEDKRQERRERKNFLREMRLAGVRNGWYQNDYYLPDFNTSFYRPYNNYYRVRPYGYRYHNNNLWSTLPLALALGLWCR